MFRFYTGEYSTNASDLNWGICTGSGYYAGPLSVPHQYQSPTKYRTCLTAALKQKLAKIAQIVVPQKLKNAED